MGFLTIWQALVEAGVLDPLVEMLGHDSSKVSRIRGVLMEGLFVLNFPYFFAHFFLFPDFPIFSPQVLGCLSVPDVLLSVKFPKFGNIFCFSCFS